MSTPIEDYALIGDCHTAALVDRRGSIDWLCLPRFDSGACFAALLGDRSHGRWSIAPRDHFTVRRRYVPETMVLETEFRTASGVCRLLDCMVIDDPNPTVIRSVEVVEGEVVLALELRIRFDYGLLVPWVRRTDDGRLLAIAGPDALLLRSPVPLRAHNLGIVGEFAASAGQNLPFVLTWCPSYQGCPPRSEPPAQALARTVAWWRAWSAQCTYKGAQRALVLRSLLTLKAATYAPTGGIVAAPTTSLPERLGGVRNWDYRYCWLRDATFTLYALLSCGYRREAERWRAWLERAVAGTPNQLKIMYGLAGERRLNEVCLPWLPGYAGSRPVRTGNAAHFQIQLDVFGEVMDMLHMARRSGLGLNDESWKVQRAMLEHLETVWREPDAGIWEVRGHPRNFTHSKVMAWVAFDRGIKLIENYGLDGPLARWRATRRRIHAQVCAQGYDRALGCFVQSYGSRELDASLLLLSLVGFLPASDPRIAGTVAAIERTLLRDGLVLRYRPQAANDGLPGDEGVFLACSFWLVDNYLLLGRQGDAERLFQRLIGLCNDVGLLAEEYDPQRHRLLGNFPQAFSHVALINTATMFARGAGRASDHLATSPRACPSPAT